MSISEQYTKEIRKQWEYSATWLPNETVELGDVGSLKDFKFSPQTTLDDLGISMGRTGPCAAKSDYYYQSKNGVSVTAKASGDATIPGSSLGVNDAGFSIKFSQDKATVFRMLGCTGTRILNLDPLMNEILSRYKNKQWADDRVVVIEAVKASSGTILVSKSSDTQVDLAATVTANIGPLDLANAKAEFNMEKSQDLAFYCIAQNGLTPLFKALGIKKSILGKPTVQPRLKIPGPGTALGKPAQGKGPQLGIVDYSDFTKSI
jgi:hypothetical protein